MSKIFQTLHLAKIKVTVAVSCDALDLPSSTVSFSSCQIRQLYYIVHLSFFSIPCSLFVYSPCPIKKLGALAVSLGLLALSVQLSSCLWNRSFSNSAMISSRQPVHFCDGWVKRPSAAVRPSRRRQRRWTDDRDVRPTFPLCRVQPRWVQAPCHR